MKYIDTHAHLVSSFTKESAEDLINESKKDGVEFILIPGTTIEDSMKGLDISNKISSVFAGFGIHPLDASDDTTTKLDDQNYNGFKFIGETGIDLYHEERPSIEVQINSFKKHLDIARKLKLPVEIHTRDAYKEVYDIIKDYQDLILIMHSFTGSLEWANKFIDLGAFISFSGIVTFKNAKEVQEVMKKIPLEKIIIETDTPFLAPMPKRGKINKPKYVKHVGDFIAKNREEKNVLEIIFKTTKDIFNI